MAYRPSLERISKNNIPITAVGNTLIGTTENGTQRFYPLFAVISVRSASGVLTVGTVSIGSNASNYNNIMPATALTGLTAIDLMLKVQLAASAIQSVAPNTDIYLRVSVAATGTQKNCDVTVIGYYQ